jgi:tetratricopeptide (TPR) repeat protein
MPTQTYMGVDVRRDHSFRVPDPHASLSFGVPNACTQCHTDRDNQWAAQVINRSNGRTEPRHPRIALLEAAEPSRPAIVLATALQENAGNPGPGLLGAVDRALASSDPLVRAAAAAALRQLDTSQRIARLVPLIDDPVKSVRMNVARQLQDLPLARAPESLRPALGKLFDEYRESLLYNADMPESMSDLALFLASQGDVDAAIEALLHARKLAPRYLPMLLNLSDMYRATGRDDLGEPLLAEAIDEYPESADARHLMGLLYVRTGRTAQAVALLRQSSQLAPDNARYALVYAVSLAETGKRPEAVAVLEAALRRFPQDASLQQALAGYR